MAAKTNIISIQVIDTYNIRWIMNTYLEMVTNITHLQNSKTLLCLFLVSVSFANRCILIDAFDFDALDRLCHHKLVDLCMQMFVLW